MENFKAKFKALFDSLGKYAEDLETSNRALREGLHSMLHEDDIKELPAYELLKMTYMPLLQQQTESVPESKTASPVTKELFDPLHAPPSARYGSKKPSQRPLAIRDEPAAAEPEHHYSTQMPDLDSCLLGTPAKAKISVKPKTAPAETSPAQVKLAPEALKIQPKPDEKVYRVEIQGKNYLRYNDGLYDAETRLRAGKLADFKLGAATDAPVELEPLTDFPGYYSGGENMVYVLVNGEVAQAVGTFEDGDLALWS